jgi:hypothetical protein
MQYCTLNIKIMYVSSKIKKATLDKAQNFNI